MRKNALSVMVMIFSLFSLVFISNVEAKKIPVEKLQKLLAMAPTGAAMIDGDTDGQIVSDMLIGTVREKPKVVTKTVVKEGFYVSIGETFPDMETIASNYCQGEKATANLIAANGVKFKGQLKIGTKVFIPLVLLKDEFKNPLQQILEMKKKLAEAENRIKEAEGKLAQSDQKLAVAQKELADSKKALASKSETARIPVKAFVKKSNRISDFVSGLTGFLFVSLSLMVLVLVFIVHLFKSSNGSSVSKKKFSFAWLGNIGDSFRNFKTRLTKKDKAKADKDLAVEAEDVDEVLELKDEDLVIAEEGLVSEDSKDKIVASTVNTETEIYFSVSDENGGKSSFVYKYSKTPDGYHNIAPLYKEVKDPESGAVVDRETIIRDEVMVIKILKWFVKQALFKGNELPELKEVVNNGRLIAMEVVPEPKPGPIVSPYLDLI